MRVVVPIIISLHFLIVMDFGLAWAGLEKGWMSRWARSRGNYTITKIKGKKKKIEMEGIIA